jgi:mannosyltransferase
VDDVREGVGVCATALAGAVAGPAVLIGLSLAGHPVYVERYALASVPLLALAAGAATRVLLAAVRTRPPELTHGSERPGRRARNASAARAVLRAVTMAALVAVGLAGVPAAAAGPADKTEDLRAGAAYLAAGYRPGDCVAYDPGWARVGVAYYLRRTPARPSDVALDASRPVVGLFPDELPQAGVEARLDACPRVWVVGYPGPVGAWRPVPEVTGAALAARAGRFTTGQRAAFGDLTVTLLVRPP